MKLTKRLEIRPHVLEALARVFGDKDASLLLERRIEQVAQMFERNEHAELYRMPFIFKGFDIRIVLHRSDFVKTTKVEHFVDE